MVLQSFFRLKRIWDKHGFVILFLLIIIFFLFYWFFETRYSSHGTYSSTYFYDPKLTNILNHSSPKNKQSPRSEKCSMSKGESICKMYLEKKFSLPFLKCRPPFLYNEVTGENLELDLYNNDLKLAVEYNGRQHYEFIPFFHQTRDRFQTQKYRDKIKKDLCEKHHIKLIVVPYTVTDDQIPFFLNQKLKELGFMFSPEFQYNTD